MKHVVFWESADQAWVCISKRGYVDSVSKIRDSSDEKLIRNLARLYCKFKELNIEDSIEVKRTPW